MYLKNQWEFSVAWASMLSTANANIERLAEVQETQVNAWAFFHCLTDIDHPPWVDKLVVVGHSGPHAMLCQGVFDVVYMQIGPAQV